MRPAAVLAATAVVLFAAIPWLPTLGAQALAWVAGCVVATIALAVHVESGRRPRGLGSVSRRTVDRITREDDDR